MSENVLEHSLSNQAKRCSFVAKAVLDNMNFYTLCDALPIKEIFDTKKIIITGCGDSWLAGIAMKPVFEKVAKIETEAMSCLELSRHLSNKTLGYEPNNPLVIGISISGTVSRVVEALQRANEYGANTLMITNSPDSVCAKTAKHRLIMGLPKPEVVLTGTNMYNYGGQVYSPGANTYIGSMLSLCSLALRMARVKNQISQDEYNAIKKSIAEYIDAVQAELDSYDERAAKIAKEWAKLDGFDFIGDYADYATAFFGSAKTLECFGGKTTYDDSEDWCHINFFMRGPERIGRVIVMNEDTPSFSRALDTLKAIETLESPCIVITNADRSLFPERFEVFSMPKAKHFWLSPLMQHWPFDLVADHIASELGVHHFRRNIDNYDNLDIGRVRLGSGTEIRII